MQEKAVVKVTLEHIPKEILISILLLLSFRDMWNLSKTSKLWNELFNVILESKAFDNQLTHKWIDKIKAEITSEPPQFTGYKVPQYKKFYMDNMVEKPKPNEATFVVITRKIGALFGPRSFFDLGLSSFIDKIKLYSANGLDIQLSRLLKNYPEMTENVYWQHYGGFASEHMKNAIENGYNKIFDVHFATLSNPCNPRLDSAIGHMNGIVPHSAIQRANIHCLKALLKYLYPLQRNFFSQKTCYAVALTLDSKHRNDIFSLLLNKTDQNELKADLNNPRPEYFTEKYGVSKSAMHLMLVQTQNDHLLASTDKDKVKSDINDLTPDAFKEKYGVPKFSLSIDDACKGIEPSNLGFKK